MIDRGKELAQSINQTAIGLSSAGNDADRQLRDNVDAINRLASQIRDLNEVKRQNFANTSDAGLDAQAHTTLEQLSELVDISVLGQPDGTLTVLLAADTAGDRQPPI